MVIISDSSNLYVRHTIVQKPSNFHVKTFVATKSNCNSVKILSNIDFSFIVGSMTWN